MKYHIGIPLLFLIALVGLAAFPDETLSALGCRNRGLWAATVGLSSGLLGVIAAFTAISRRLRGVEGSERWILSAALFAVPVGLLLYLA